LAVTGVELGDDRALLFDAIGREPARDRERLAVVGEDLERMTPAAGGLGHDLDRRWVPSDHSE
jgi:hypothetical protein